MHFEARRPAYIESFNGKLRAECLNQHRFLTLDDSQLKMAAWRRDYNEDRPHSAIGIKALISLMSVAGTSGAPPVRPSQILQAGVQKTGLTSQKHDMLAIPA